MEDIFYFTERLTTLDQIKVAAQNAGHRVERYDRHSGSWLNVYYESDRFWAWEELGEKDLQNLSPAGQDTLRRLPYSTAFMVSIHGDSLPKLRVLMKKLLKTYGGWIGGDTIGFEPIYTAESVHQLWYPYL